MRRPSGSYRKANVERFLDQYARASLERQWRQQDMGRATVEHVI